MSVRETMLSGPRAYYEAAVMLTTFVLLGHWFEMRARGGANDAIRAQTRAERRTRTDHGLNLHPASA